ncbi:uncharacterized protein [Drosophila takahashii]|uniref:uncharacterized protein n=1 Tax=Drosophila takahashii TaxID=29030 RepID=UPI001CF91E5B|nr:uncharacterized protein LOC108059752 [Drosophila takahashii]
MFKSPNKQVTKFQSVVVQRIVSRKSTSIGSSNKQTSSDPVISVFHASKHKNVAKITSASCDLSARKVSEKTPEKSPSKPKSLSQRSIRIASARPQVVENPSSKNSRLGSSRSTGTTRITASTRTQQFYIPLRSSHGVTSRMYRPSHQGVFHYDLSPLERTGFNESLIYPMKSVPAAELQLLRNGQRSTYLERRYERSPDDKYNYPEATSWRYGWFHRESDPFQKRIPRRD